MIRMLSRKQAQNNSSLRKKLSLLSLGKFAWLVDSILQSYLHISLRSMQRTSRISKDLYASYSFLSVTIMIVNNDDAF